MDEREAFSQVFTKPPPGLSVMEMPFPMKLSRKPRDIMHGLSGLGISGISSSQNSLSVVSVQSQDLNGNPYLCVKAAFSPGSAKLSFTYEPKGNLAHRKLDALSWFFHVISAGKAVKEWPPEFLGAIAEALQGASDSMSQSYDKAASELSTLKEEHARLSEKYARLLAEHEAQARALLDATSKLDSQATAIKELKSMSDEAMDEEVMEHLNAHGGAISVREFASALGVTTALVEASLDRLSKGGYIARIK